MKKKQKSVRALNTSINAQSKLIKKLLNNNPIQVYWVSKTTAAKLYGVSIRTIYNWKEQEKINWKEINDKTYYSILPLIEPNY